MLNISSKSVRLYLFFIFFSIFCMFCFAEETDDYDETSAENQIETTISKQEFKIGQKVTLTTKISNLLDMKALWQDISKSNNDFEVVSTRDFYSKNKLILEIVFTSFTPGEYEDIFFTIPLKSEDGQVMYFETKRYNLSVFGEISQNDLDMVMSQIKSEEDLAKIEIKQPKSQEKFSYNFTPYIKWILIILFVLLLCAIVFYLLWNFILKKKITEKAEEQIPPFDVFVATMEMLEFNDNDLRNEIEKKLSTLTESLKQLITGEMGINASTETTRELITALKKAQFKIEWINIINQLFSEIDMIKFAKADYTINELYLYKDKIKQLGFDIHGFYRDMIAQHESNVGGKK